MTHDLSSDWPSWLRDVNALLAVHPQFVLAGNVRDRYLLPLDDLPVSDDLPTALLAGLAGSGFDCLLIHDLVDGYRVLGTGTESEAWAAVQAATGLQLQNAAANDLGCLQQVLRRIAIAPTRRIAFVVDYASRLVEDPGSLHGDERELFLAALKLSHTAERMFVASSERLALFNPVFWIIDRELDLPAWFTAMNPGVRSIPIPWPDLSERTIASEKLLTRVDEQDRPSVASDLAALTSGLSIGSLFDIVTLSVDQGIDLSDLEDAVRTYKVGAAESPWRRGAVAQRLRSSVTDEGPATAEAFLERRVLGQPRAVTKSVDILKRAVLGLSGAQASRQSGRPRGVLFLAGPTGTGKTELAKTITELVFGTDDAYVRFDMSEFSAEHAGDRLIGAPPGYVGFDAGGELTNAVRRRPYCLLLFDEIEKANPRILDKFLQILEDGRLTDGRGTTVHFTETIIVFTSNLGTFVPDNDRLGTRRANITPEDDYETIERNVRSEIYRYFTQQLNRPELLNRVGDNVIVFDFIRADVATRIIDLQVANVLERVAETLGIEVTLAAAARTELEAFATADLSFGGRGIGNVLESALINPLARALFTLDPQPGQSVVIAGLASRNGTFELDLE